ncbi:MAG: hypothetical protein NT165_02945 [Candidatus Falkowbacteria bacterium]|nr:hypothetical protein [Candidatus Falkowbacteria bacterium]
MEEFKRFIGENAVLTVLIIGGLIASLIFALYKISQQKQKKQDLIVALINYTNSLVSIISNQGGIELGNLGLHLRHDFNGYNTSSISKLVIESIKKRLDENLKLSTPIYTNSPLLLFLNRHENNSYHFYYQMFYDKKILLTPEKK